MTLGGSQEMTLGVMGGGQLGRMFAHAAQQMGFFTAVLDPDATSPAGRISHHHVQTAYTDAEGLARLAAVSAAITTEFENVPAEALNQLAQSRPVAPSGAAVAIAQDRAAEKAHFVQCGVPCAPYAVIETAEQLAAIETNLLPGILKTARMGYDGKGQVRVETPAELAAAWADLKQVPCVLEKMLPLQWECSVIVARGADGACVNLPVQRNLHRDGILAVTEVYEGNVPPALAERAVAAAKSIASGVNYVGVLCVEFFVLDESHPAAAGLGGLVVNEMAPRPHNSGHYSMDACDVSQFHLQVRTLAGLPLVQPRQHSPSIMLNLLGDIWPQDGRNGGVPDWAAVLALPGTHLHLYGKLAAKKGRKMGHLNVTGATIEQVRATALEAARILGIAAF
ncbi:5-(carboxyamino)imidazole ribonucleotide synthase [Rhodoferax mekongensis]|uniref:5-(carboxyamino)imidazole ribonucleotide synthase n=1 Tax=Rhodoferax mekongensis TaxID=3068341 RepID=UPI0028BF11A0|nr:5-(carboxyamino)imidazole ribonucleotide synthase [Rhodoferax sp. TBRC 17199]MDT7513516.1 5-(carboxyamino)imidazole ribonucleotide synthase [Rhodoferax sp. TBRC 17199]